MTFTKGQLIEHINGRKELAEECVSDSTLHPERREYYALSLATLEIALAALASRADAEPVGYYRLAEDGVSYYLSSPTEHRDGCIPLYTRPQPAPVVPDSKVITPHFDTLALDTAREIMCDINRRGELLGGDVQLLSRIQCRIDNACRAAMLQSKAEPVSQPYTLPDDKQRLDWLDAQNKRLNEYYGTAYGWKFDANFQRNAMMLNDSNYPVMNVRQAIDEAMRTATRLQEAQEVKK